MRRTGGILVGETATAFFTGASRAEEQNVDLVLYNTCHDLVCFLCLFPLVVLFVSFGARVPPTLAPTTYN